MMKTAFSARSARNISRLLAVFMLTVTITPVYAFGHGGGRGGGGGGHR